MSDQKSHPEPAPEPSSGAPARPSGAAGPPAEQEHPRPDPTRYGDWEKNGRCIDF